MTGKILSVLGALLISCCIAGCRSGKVEEAYGCYIAGTNDAPLSLIVVMPEYVLHVGASDSILHDRNRKKYYRGAYKSELVKTPLPNGTLHILHNKPSRFYIDMFGRKYLDFSIYWFPPFIVDWCIYKEAPIQVARRFLMSRGITYNDIAPLVIHTRSGEKDDQTSPPFLRKIFTGE